MKGGKGVSGQCGLSALEHTTSCYTERANCSTLCVYVHKYVDTHIYSKHTAYKHTKVQMHVHT